MKIDRHSWNRAMSLMYAMSVWTLLGCILYYERNKAMLKKKDKEDENLNQVVYQTAYMKTVVTYKKDFVPYTTRIYNFFKSPSSGDK